MATVKAVILKEKKRNDGTWNVKIRIIHEKKVSYMATSHYVSIDCINKKTFELKERNNPVYDQVMIDVLKIRSQLSALGHQIDYYTAQGLVRLMKDKLSGKPDGINFFDFAENHIQKLIKQDKRTSQSYRAMLSRLEEFAGSRNLMFSDITSNFLFNFDTFLRASDSKHGFGKISSSGVRLYIGKIQHLFNLAKLKYNDEDAGIVKIANNPFVKYKLPKVNGIKKKALSAEDIKRIKEFDIPVNMKGAMIARDVFVMSFLLCGMNTVDMYFLRPEINGRYEYERRKTAGRRDDKAFISIRIEPELEPYIDRYMDEVGDRAFNFFLRYSSDKQFVTKVNGNLKYIGDALGIENLTLYAARHSFATIARNDCGVSMDDVAMALNHKSGHDVTDTYIKKDWKRIDDVNRKVIDYVFGKKEKAEE